MNSDRGLWVFLLGFATALQFGLAVGRLQKSIWLQRFFLNFWFNFFFCNSLIYLHSEKRLISCSVRFTSSPCIDPFSGSSFYYIVIFESFNAKDCFSFITFSSFFHWLPEFFLLFFKFLKKSFDENVNFTNFRWHLFDAFYELTLFKS